MAKVVLKYIINQWLDTKTFETTYGIDAKFDDGSKMHCADGGIPCFFSTRAEAETKVKELNKSLGGANG